MSQAERLFRINHLLSLGQCLSAEVLLNDLGVSAATPWHSIWSSARAWRNVRGASIARAVDDARLCWRALGPAFSGAFTPAWSTHRRDRGRRGPCRISAVPTPSSCLVDAPHNAERTMPPFGSRHRTTRRLAQ